MSKKKRKHPELNKNCFNCNHCQYIGEGGYICDMSNDIVIEDADAKADVAMEIFEEIGKILYKHTNIAIKEKSITCELAIDYIGEDIAELKKKYTEGGT